MSDRRGAPKTVLSGVGVWKMPLVRVSHPLSVRTEFISPHEGLSGLATSRREFPFRFGGQTFSGPLRVCHRVFIRHLYHRIILLPTNAALRPLGMAPVGISHIGPPLEMIIERHRMTGRRKDDTASHQIFRWRSGKIFRARSTFRDSYIAGSFHKS